MEERIAKTIGEIRSIKSLDSFDEAATKQIIVLRLLRDLGWNEYDRQDVWPEYLVDEGKSAEKVDYALAPNTENMVFIEVKKISSPLDNAAEQLRNYSAKRNQDLVVLTNGISWQFYLPREKGSWYERKCFSIDIQNQPIEEINEKFVQFLSKSNVIEGRSLEFAKKAHKESKKKDEIKKSLPKAWNNLLGSEDERLCDLLNEYLEKICGYPTEPEDVAEYLSQVRTGESSFLEKEDSSVHIGVEKEKTEYVPKGYTGKTPVSFTLSGKTFEVKSWKEVLVKVCEEMYGKNKDDFSNVLSLMGRSRPYFSKEEGRDKLRIPTKIGNTPFFVETNLSANSIISRCNDVLGLFGYNENLEIKTKE